MPTPPNKSPRQSDRERTESRLGRRRVLYAGSAATVVAVAGCLSNEEPADASDDGEGNETDESDGVDSGSAGDEESDEGTEDELFDAVDAYLEAAADADTDALAEVMHSASPLHPEAWEEEGWEFQGGTEDGGDIDPFEGEVVTTDGAVEDIFEFEYASFWFEEAELREQIGDEAIALVAADDDWLASNGDPASDDDLESATWVLVTEDDEWRVFFVGAEEEEPPENPEEAFEEEIIDEDDDVVAEIDWEFEQEDAGDAFGDVEWAQVVLTDSPGLQADRIRIESTIEGSETELYGQEPGAWADTWATVALYPEGDQVVVTAISDGEETIVHREHYLPESESESESDTDGDTDA